MDPRNAAPDDDRLAHADAERIVDAFLPADAQDPAQAARRATLSPAWSRLSETRTPQSTPRDFDPPTSRRTLSKPVTPAAPWLRDGAFDSTSQRKLK